MTASMAEFGSTLQTNGYKLTIQRRAVLEIIFNNKEKHLSTEEIFYEVRKTHPGIGLATIYRTLQVFEKIGLVWHLALDDGYLRYQMADPEEKHEHHHLVCEICGEVIDVKDDLLETLEEKVQSENGFTVNNHRVQLYGICKKCAEKQAREKEDTR